MLVVDDEPQIRRLLRVTLEAAGLTVKDATDGAEAIREAAYLKPDCLVLDLGLPDMDGVEVVRRIREWSDVPIVILSVRDEPGQKITALEVGADDYVTKPFDAGELVARCRAVMRRRSGGSHEASFVQGDLAIDFAARTVSVGGRRIDLTATEYALLRMLALNAGKILVHAQILRQVWGPKSEEHRQYLRVYIAALRRKLGPAARIKTESGIGYRLETDG
ncbi:MAG: response regulator transcription factor [Opitutaceae bacterium]|nr:response regulator transcription factor [Opitutaceae bacterium]